MSKRLSIVSGDAEGPPRGVYGRGHGGPYHHHGPGVKGAARHRLGRPRADPAGISHLRSQLRLPRDLLEQPSPHAARDPADQWRDPLGEPASAVLAVAGAVYHRLDGREPFLAAADRDLR